MADFRDRINDLKANHNEDELVDRLAEELGERPTSVNPLSESMFRRIAPDSRPEEYGKRSDDYSPDRKPVARNAIALKLLLHDQVGRPLYNRVLRLKKQDFAECLVAIEAYEEGYERIPGEHVPTTLPVGAGEFLTDVPERESVVKSPFDTVVELSDGYQSRTSEWLNRNPEIADSPYCVYVLDCTPDLDDENDKLRDLRRVVQTKLNSGMTSSELELEERAAAALNEGKRVYYVGATSDIEKRVDEHVVGTAVSGVNFTTNIPPERFVEVTACDSKAEARRLEGKRAIQIDDREGLFAYSDEM